MSNVLKLEQFRNAWTEVINQLDSCSFNETDCNLIRWYFEDAASDLLMNGRPSEVGEKNQVIKPLEVQLTIALAKAESNFKSKKFDRDIAVCNVVEEFLKCIPKFDFR
ncbi:MAG: hypothetical protein FWF66_02075 [Candidatus Bathyarchaeota archaeon]|nr:hypothetical protein [Candidatus Termiticorpusculum sp.]